jgi:hypothetical protein
MVQDSPKALLCSDPADRASEGLGFGQVTRKAIDVKRFSVEITAAPTFLEFAVSRYTIFTDGRFANPAPPEFGIKERYPHILGGRFTDALERVRIPGGDF